LLDARPAVVDGVVYFCEESTLLAVDSKTGRELWKFDTKEVIWTGSPTVADRVVYFGTGHTSIPGRREGYGRLYAVDSETGQQKHRIGIVGDKFTTDSSPAVANGVIYLGSDDGHLYAIEPPFDTQARRRPTIWKFKTGARIASSAAVADGVVYVASWDKHLYAVDIKTQQEKWKFKTGGAVGGSLAAVADGVVYVSIDDGPNSSVSHADSQLYAVDAKTGQEKWRFKTGDKIRSSPAVADGVVYVGSNDSHLYAVDAKSGREKWKFKTGGKVLSSPAVADGVVYVGSEDGYLYAIQAKSNAPAPARSTPSASAAAPTASQEIPRLVARLNQNYHRDMPEMHWADGSVFDDGYIRKDHAVALEKDFTLVARYLECTIPEPSWRFGDNARIPADYRMSAHSTEDCDKARHGLSWQEKIVRQPLATIDPSAIGLEKTGKGDSDSGLRLTFGSVLDKFAFSSMSCKNREACEQMAADLKRLIEMARNAAASGKTPSR
jgi:outer membrane protein assembly factor BamB